jgi:hypothetical protein
VPQVRVRPSGQQYGLIRSIARRTGEGSCVRGERCRRCAAGTVVVRCSRGFFSVCASILRGATTRRACASTHRPSRPIPVVPRPIFPASTHTCRAPTPSLRGPRHVRDGRRQLRAAGEEAPRGAPPSPPHSPAVRPLEVLQSQVLGARALSVSYRPPSQLLKFCPCFRD